MDNIKPFLGIVVGLLAIVGIGYTLSSKFKNLLGAFPSVNSNIDRISRTSSKQPTTDDQKILDIIVAITDIYKATEKDN